MQARHSYLQKTFLEYQEQRSYEILYMYNGGLHPFSIDRLNLSINVTLVMSLFRNENSQIRKILSHSAMENTLH